MGFAGKLRFCPKIKLSNYVNVSLSKQLWYITIAYGKFETEIVQ